MVLDLFFHFFQFNVTPSFAHFATGVTQIVSILHEDVQEKERQ